ncbi:MAG: T9SS type A sorting domain-containing protein [Bacteroidales bacterium]|nr:T9SS type A sorting domain-containing protein [Bacteroidales bacterium]
MKRTLLLFAASIMAVTMSYAQKLDGKTEFIVAEQATNRDAVWGTFTNFVQADMNGNYHNIQNYLDQGKYVIIDFFCAWCTPCYSLHQSGRLEAIYNTYGQGGTGEIVVLMVECQLSNTAAQISGTTTASSYAGFSAGDFTSGGTNPIPIIDATVNYAWNVSLYEGAVPSVYLFCPSGYVTSIYSMLGQTPEQIFAFAQENCPDETDAPIQAEIHVPTHIYTGEGANISSFVVSASDETSYEWTFEGATPATATTASVENVIWEEYGDHEISLTVTNPNGSTTATKTINVINCNITISEFPYYENFENGRGCWTLISMNEENTERFGVMEYATGMHGMVFSSFNRTTDYNQYLISKEIVHTDPLNLSFKYVKLNPSSNGEKFTVKYSTTDNEISSFVALGDEITANSNTLQTYRGVLPADAKYFMINYNTDYEYTLAVDDIRLDINTDSFIEGEVSSKAQIYPNPTNGILNVVAEGLNNVEIIDVTGRVVVSSTESCIDLSGVEAGVYFVKAYTEKGNVVKKVVKE